MPTVVKHRRGTTAQNAAFTGASGEISIDLDKKTLLIHDSATAGGFEMLGRNLTNQTIAGHMIPAADSTYSLGDSAAKWKSLYLSGNTIYLGDATISATGSAVTLPAGSTVAGTGFTLDSAGIYGLLTAGTGVTYNGAGQYSIGQDVATTADVNFATVETTGNVTVGGDLIVNGNTTTINSTTLDVDDLNITVAKGAASAAAANGAGLTVDGGGASINYTSATDTWDFNKPFGTNTNVISNYTTTQLGEGDNLYYTRARFDSALGDATSQSTIRGYFSAAGDLSYNSSTGEFSFDVENVYTQANFDSDFNTALDATNIGGTGLAYNSTTNVISIDSAELTSSYSAPIRSLFSAAGDLTYNASTGQFSFDVESVYTQANFDSDFNTSLDAAALDGKGLTYSIANNTLSIDSSELYAQYKHDDFSDYVADEHVAHSGVEITAGSGLTGGGDITATRTLNVVGGKGITANADDIQIDSAELYSQYKHDDFNDYVADEHVAHSGVTITAGAGLTGGGDITTSRTINAVGSAGIVVNADNIAIDSSHIRSLFSGSAGVNYNSGTGAFDVDEANVLHDNLSGFVADEHVAHTGVTITAGRGLSGGGDISASRTINLDSAEFAAYFNTANLPEGSNLYYTTARADSDAKHAISGSTGITYSSDTGIITTNDGQIVHDNLSGFVANEHIDHTSVSITAGRGLSGGGTITTSRTVNIDSAELAAYFSTSNLPEGSNLYYTTARADSDAKHSITGGTGITYNSTTGEITTTDTEIVHDNLSGFVADEHVAHTSVTITAGSGLTGGGDISTSRTLNIGQGTGITVSADAISTNDSQIVHDNLSGFVADEHVAHSGVTITAGNGLTGGGDISASRTLNVGAGTGVTVSADAVSIGQDVATTADVTFNSITTTDGLIVGGNLQVTGTTTTVNSQTLEVTDNMIYMNAGESDGSPIQSIDVGWAANVNDGGSYTHVGMFRDATDDRFKVFGAYTPEPDAALEINTGHASFALADFQAATFHGALSGNATTATTLETARTIGGVSFDGSANINLPGVNTTGNQDTSGNAATATKLATARTIGGVSFDGSANINLPGVNTTGNQNTTGSAATLTTARDFSISGDITANAVSFDGSGNVALSAAITAGSIVNADINASAAIADTKLATISTSGKVSNSATTATSANTASAIVARDGNGDFTARHITLSSGDLKLDEYVLNSQTATTTSTSQTAVATFPVATYGSAEIVVTAKDGTARHISKLLVVHNGTTADATEFGTITTGSSLATYTVDISGGNVRLLATPATANSTVFNVALTLIDA